MWNVAFESTTWPRQYKDRELGATFARRASWTLCVMDYSARWPALGEGQSLLVCPGFFPGPTDQKTKGHSLHL